MARPEPRSEYESGVKEQIGRTFAPMDLAPAEPPAPSRLVHESAVPLTSAVARHWQIAALIAVAAMLFAWLAAAVQPKRYRASAIAAVAPLAANLPPQDLMRGVDTLERRVVVSSLAALAGTPRTRRAVHAAGDETILAVVLPNTNLFRIEVEGRDPKRAAALANEVPAVLAVHARTMYRLYDVTLVSEATAPSQPSRPRIERALAAGLGLGIFLGAAAAWLLDRRRAGAS